MNLYPSGTIRQPRQREWAIQWKEFKDDSIFLFKEWISPSVLEDFSGKHVLDAGCGGGQHLGFIAPYASRAVGVDLNTAEIAREKTACIPKVRIREADIAAMELGETFDIVYSLGVVHHTDDPDRTVENLKRHVKAGGRLILWVYAEEGNGLTRALLEPLKRGLLLKLPKRVLKSLAATLTTLMYLAIYSIYLLPFRTLPYYEYFQNWRQLPFRRNLLNVFDKLNAPQTIFIRREQVERWINPEEFSDIHISHYKGVSWRASGTKT